MKKLIALLLTLLLLVGLVVVISAESTEYSIAVDNSTADNETRISTVDVYATQSSTYSVKIPKSIVLNGKTGDGSYKVSVRGNISGNQTVKVVPVKSFTLSEIATLDAKPDITAKITQSKTSWTTSELSMSSWTTQKGTISAPSISAGYWSGTFNFAISITNAG